MNRSELVTVFRYLRNAAPEEFAKAAEGFASYATAATVAVTEADPNDILKMQGRAQQARAILLVLQEASSDPRTQ